MSIVQKGSRRIVVDQVAYRWTIRRQPTYSQGLAWGSLSFDVMQEMDIAHGKGCAACQHQCITA